MNRSTGLVWLVIVTLTTGAGLVAAGCGGDGAVNPTLIGGGGVADPGVSGAVNVYIIDDDTDQPLAGAAVAVGELAGTTDEGGLFVAADGALSGPQTITATAEGYTPSTWVGVNDANVTIPLSVLEAPTSVPEARLQGTIDGFDDLTVPQGKANVALVTYSANRDDGDPANNLMQPSGNPRPNSCVNTGGAGATPCSWTLRTRTGQQTVYAFLGTIDAQQNLVFTGFAYASGISVERRRDARRRDPDHGRQRRPGHPPRVVAQRARRH